MLINTASNPPKWTEPLVTLAISWKSLVGVTPQPLSGPEMNLSDGASEDCSPPPSSWLTLELAPVEGVQMLEHQEEKDRTH